jgi:GDP-L-fucose synthase
MDISKPDGTPRKLLNIDRLTSLGWRPKIELQDGLAETYQWFAERFQEEACSTRA